MVRLGTFLLAASGALALPHKATEAQLLTRAGTPNSNGQHGGYYYSFWSDGVGTVNYQNADKGSFAVNWQNCSNFYGGKGWNPGTSARTISFNGTFSTSGNAYLSIYGWTKSPQVEYYIIESHGTYDPSKYAQEDMGSYTSDGSVYHLARAQRVLNLPAGGSALQYQYWAVRKDKRTSGRVDVGNHFKVWQEKGLRLGVHDMQIVAVEGYQSSGEAEVTVW